MLRSIKDASRIIEAGTPVLAAGSHAALSQLPPGRWIAGTIPYFMDVRGGTCSETDVFVTELPGSVASVSIRTYPPAALPQLIADGPDNGFTAVIIPAGGTCHREFAENAPSYEGAFTTPLVGWIAGVHLSKLGVDQPLAFDGVRGASVADAAVAMHVTLPPDKLAEIDIVNVFAQGAGPAITFPRSGFEATDCLVGGQPSNLASYLRSAGVDTRLPLTADYNGSVVNVSIQQVDEQAGRVIFYAPVFEGMEYKVARPVGDYVAEFGSAIGNSGVPAAAFACNCVLNYLYGDLEGKRTGSITGPITFGEIAYQLLNQTLVRLSLRDVRA